MSFPAVCDLALRGKRLGKSSVCYEIALFERGLDSVKAVGEVFHVFVDKGTGKPVASGMSSHLRHRLQELLVVETKL